MFAGAVAAGAVPRYFFNWFMLVWLKPGCEDMDWIVFQPAAVGANNRPAEPAEPIGWYSYRP